MSAGWFRTLFGAWPAEPDGVERSFECTACESVYREWPGSCRRCDQLVVRVVDRGPVNAR